MAAALFISKLAEPRHTVNIIWRPSPTDKMAPPDTEMSLALRQYSNWERSRHAIEQYRLERNLEYGPNVEPLQLPEQDDPTPVDKTGTLAGWGDIDEFNDEPLTLQKVNLTVFSYNYCDQYLSAPFDPAQDLCADVSANDQGQCYGDGGGPLVVDGVQVGIASWSLKPCTSAPGVFTRVSPFRNWIKTVSGV
ncbi:trypsin-6-like [Cylas formicarius]|uniref:trypsin-6-like n=1 Tax=Cylas formicarius TaxID=197179 RepID=UPI0029589824|nr:trypsin-6-like [Cylas formicarius]